MFKVQSNLNKTGFVFSGIGSRGQRFSQKGVSFLIIVIIIVNIIITVVEQMELSLSERIKLFRWSLFSAPLQHSYWPVAVGLSDSHHLIAVACRVWRLIFIFWNAKTCAGSPFPPFLTVLFNKPGSGFSPHYPQNPEKLRRESYRCARPRFPKQHAERRIRPDLDLVRARLNATGSARPKPICSDCCFLRRDLSGGRTWRILCVWFSGCCGGTSNAGMAAFLQCHLESGL